jgi:hypothetical protein
LGFRVLKQAFVLSHKELFLVGQHWQAGPQRHFERNCDLEQLGIRVRFASSKMRSESSEPQPEIADLPFDAKRNSVHTHQKKPDGLSRFETLGRLRLALRVKMNARQNPSTAPKRTPTIVLPLNERLPWPAHKKPT